MDGPEFLSIKEFADRVRMHPNSIRRAIKAGKLNAFQVGEGRCAVYRIPITQVHVLAIYNIEKIVNSLIDKKMNAN